MDFSQFSLSLCLIICCGSAAIVPEYIKCLTHQTTNYVYSHEHKNNPCQNYTEPKNDSESLISKSLHGTQNLINHGAHKIKDSAESVYNGTVQIFSRTFQATQNKIKQNVDKTMNIVFPEDSEESNLIRVFEEGETTTTMKVEDRNIFQVPENCHEGERRDSTGKCREEM